MSTNNLSDVRVGRVRPRHDPGYPTCSWWAGTTREEFKARLADELPRMQTSRYAQIVSLSFGQAESVPVRLKAKETREL